MDTNTFYKTTEQYVTGLFTSNNKPELAFHNLEHTKSVVQHTKEIAGHYYLSENDLLVVFVAAWFHDTGYLFTDPQHHEEKSVELMKTFMQTYSTDQETVQKIEQCIIATRPPVTHASLAEQIICDADTYHFGTKEFKDTNQKVWQEYKNTGAILTEKEWITTTIDLLNTHRFYTKYCMDLLDKRKQKNMKKLKKKIEFPGDEDESLSIDHVTKDKAGLVSKGIQTMLRMTSNNHLRLSYMADHKANLLISVNAIIISVMLSIVFRKLEEVPYLTVPTIIFLLVAVTTIVIAIIATRPKLGNGNFAKQDIIDKKTNLLFFGNFHKASYEQYDEAMRAMMQDPDYLYGSLIKDIYALGTVLGRKYKLIRLAYNIFMVGIIISVITFALAYFFFRGTNPAAVTQGGGSPF